MSIRELMRTLEKGRQEKLARARAAKPSSEKPPIDWKRRRRTRNRIFFRWFGLLAAMVGFSVVFVILPLWLVHPPLGETVLLAMPPTLFIAASWMLGAWYTYDKSRELALTLTVGMMPVRFAFFAAWVWLVHTIPGVDFRALIVAMMVFWVLFSIPEFAMLAGFTKHLQRTAEREPDDVEDDEI